MLPQMQLDGFRLLSENEKLTLVNERLKQLKDQKLTTKDFRTAELEFSYTSAYKELESLGYGRHGDSFVKQQQGSPSLDETEIATLKRMIADYQSNSQTHELEPRVPRRTDAAVVSTSIRINKQVWQRFQAYAEDWSIYRTSDLLSLALERFLDQHGFDDYESLVQRGKIKEE